MSLIVEDGTGKSDAEAYCDVAYADDYHSKRDNTSWAALSTATKEACLRKGTDYLVGAFRQRWKGMRRLTTQSLDWPRVGCVLPDFTSYPTYGLIQVPFTIVPTEVKNACAEMSLRAIIGPLAADQSKNIIEERVGPILVKYDLNASQAINYVQVTAMLSPYTNDGAGNVMTRLTRS